MLNAPFDKIFAAMNMQLIPHVIRFHPRLLFAVVVGALVSIFPPAAMTYVPSALIGWDAGAWTYLAMLAFMMASPSYKRARERAETEDESAMTVLSVISISAIASLVAIVQVLATAKTGASNLTAAHVIFAATTLIAGWLLVPMIYTLHYARLYFGDRNAPKALHFPDADLEPDYLDFLYFSITIAVASQTADISIASKRMRRTVLAQSVLSFIFNIAVLGLSINIGAGLLS